MALPTTPPPLPNSNKGDDEWEIDLETGLPIGYKPPDDYYEPNPEGDAFGDTRSAAEITAEAFEKFEAQADEYLIRQRVQRAAQMKADIENGEVEGYEQFRDWLLEQMSADEADRETELVSQYEAALEAARAEREAALEAEQAEYEALLLREREAVNRVAAERIAKAKEAAEAKRREHITYALLLVICVLAVVLAVFFNSDWFQERLATTQISVNSGGPRVLGG